MMRYVGRRLLQSALILVGVSFITFFLLYILPADPAQQIAGKSATPETIANIRVQLGLDQPLFVQYWHYLVNLVHGNFGRSYIQRTDVSELLASRIGPTLYLMICSIGMELVIGITAGVIAAVNRGKTSDNAIMLFSFIGVSAPQFILSILMLYVFAVKLKWFPIGGYGTPAHFVLPALTLGILGSGWYGRVMRSSMLDVMRQDYIRTSRAKGATELRVVLVHSLRNAVLPIVAMIGLDIGIFMGGVVVVESVFAWPGIGQLAWQAIQRVDIPIIMGVTLVAAIAIVLGNLLADLLGPLVDPRIKLNR